MFKTVAFKLLARAEGLLIAPSSVRVLHVSNELHDCIGWTECKVSCVVLSTDYKNIECNCFEVVISAITYWVPIIKRLNILREGKYKTLLASFFSRTSAPFIKMPPLGLFYHSWLLWTPPRQPVRWQPKSVCAQKTHAKIKSRCPNICLPLCMSGTYLR